MTRAAWLAAALLLAVAGPVPTQQGSDARPPEEAPPPAAEDTLDERVREIAASLRCPVCLNLSVEDSPSQLARDMKEFIRDRLEAGWDAERIRQHFVDRYGEWVLMAPEPEGLNLALWIVPALAVVGGGALVATLVRRWKRRGSVRESEGAS